LEDSSDKKAAGLYRVTRYTSFICQVVTTDKETGLIRIYRSGPRRVFKNLANFDINGYSVILFAGGSNNKGQVCLIFPYNASRDRKVPTYANTVVEIYIGKDKCHLVPFARLPEPGSFNNWNELNRIGKSSSFFVVRSVED
jgi:hypothetical protein